MKKALIFIFSLFLISSLNCAPTKQEATKTEEPTQEVMKTDKAVNVPFDLTGTWIETSYSSGCGDNNKKELFTDKITQQGNTIHLLVVENNHQYIGKIYKNSISFKGIRFTSTESENPGNLIVHDFTLMIGQDANTLTGKIRWTWRGARGGICDGISNLSLRRKLEE